MRYARLSLRVLLVVGWLLLAVLVLFSALVLGITYSVARIAGDALSCRLILLQLIAIDQLGNAMLGGDEDETISSRMGKAVRAGSCRLCLPVCWLLDRLDPRGRHCERSIEADEGGDQVWDWAPPPEPSGRNRS